MGRTTKLSIPSGTITESTGVGVPLGWHDCGYDRNVILSSSTALPKVPLINWFGSEFNYSQLQNSYLGWPSNATSLAWFFTHSYADYDLGKIFAALTAAVGGSTFCVGFLQFDIATQVWSQLYCFSSTATTSVQYAASFSPSTVQIEDIKNVGGEYRMLMKSGYAGNNVMFCANISTGTVYIHQSNPFSSATVEGVSSWTGNNLWHGRFSSDGSTIYIAATLVRLSSGYNVAVAYGTKAYNSNDSTFTVTGGVAVSGTSVGGSYMDSRRKVLVHKDSAIDMHVFCYSQNNSNVPVGLSGVLYTSKVWGMAWQDNEQGLSSVASSGSLVAYDSNLKYSGANNILSSSLLRRVNYAGTGYDSIAHPENRYSNDPGTGNEMAFVNGTFYLFASVSGAYIYASHVLINDAMHKIDLAIANQVLTLTGSQAVAATYQNAVDDTTEQVFLIKTDGIGSAGTLRACKVTSSSTYRIAPIKSGYMVKL